eukprot:6392334-Ditylum_brightwellii.AAC.1
MDIVMNKQYYLCKIHTLPVVVGTLGTVCKNSDICLVKVSSLLNVDTIQTKVLLGSDHILQPILIDTVADAYIT